jgi:hypothetical protein
VPSSSILIAFCTSVAVSVGFMLAEARCIHWFIVPIVLCGTIIGTDAVAWAHGRLDPLDPVGIIGLFGYYFFFLTPLLHVLWNVWMRDVPTPPDGRDWLGRMAIWNLFGLVIYWLARGRVARMPEFPRGRRLWIVDRNLFRIVLAIACMLSVLLQLWVYWRYGGLSGYIQRYVESYKHYGTTDPNLGFADMGWIFTFSESFPLLAMMGFGLYAKAKGKIYRGWPMLLVVLGVVFVLQLLFGGLRGGRSNTVWVLFWAVGIIHFCVRRITKTTVCVGIIFLVSFMYFYEFYKHYGPEGLTVFQQSGTSSHLPGSPNVSMIESVLLADFARSDVQASTLYELTGTARDYEYALGRTYWGALALLIPRSIWPDRPPTKVAWTTALETGKGSYQPGVWQSSHVYGLAGEAMLNFGPVAMPFAFAIFGFVVGGIRRFVFSLGPDDIRFLVVPFLILLSFQLLVNDADVILFFIFKYGTMPFAVVVLCSRRACWLHWRRSTYKVKRPIVNVTAKALTT